MPKKQIMAAFTNTASEPLGDIWTITAKKSDFYLDAVTSGRIYHLSAHGPSGTQSGHRFHLKIDPGVAAARAKQGDFVAHGIPKGGQHIVGQSLGDDAYLVARIRWLWELQRLRFKGAARVTKQPKLTGDRSGVMLSNHLRAQYAADLDVFVSFKKPYWPDEKPSAFRKTTGQSLRDNARLGPLQNDAGFYLTAVSYQRSLSLAPFPDRLVPRLPKAGEQPSRIMCAGPGPGNDLYWFVHAITSREVLDAWPGKGSAPVGYFR